jgi:hypothetical protein
VAKIYTKEQKYDSTNGSFDYKLTIFLDICNRVKLLKEGYLRAFPTMLKGLALDHFYNAKLSQRTYPEAYNNICGFFEGLSYYRRNLDQ